MTEAEYRYECSRAELLGVPKPTWEEFVSTKKEASGRGTEEEEEITAEGAEGVEARKEGFRNISGGLDELNSILSSTQKKLNRFKTVCGSFSNILKLHIGTKKEDENKGDGCSAAEDDSGQKEIAKQTQGEGGKIMLDSPQHRTKGDAHSELDKLDSLINKAERAELSLSSQNKQMKKFLN